MDGWHNGYSEPPKRGSWLGPVGNKAARLTT